jgi:hypothetical protein
VHAREAKLAYDGLVSLLSGRRPRAAAIVLVLALVVTVIGVAQLGPSQVVVTALNTDWSCRSRDAELGVPMYEAGCKGTRDVGLGEVPIHINQAGFRGTPPIKGSRKVLILGGSTLFGPGLTNNYEAGKLLEAALKKEGFDRDVLNLSVEGYTTTQHVIRFKQYLEKYNPELVVLDTLSNHKMFLDLVLQHALVTNDVGQPRKLLSASHAWGTRIDGWLPRGIRAWARTVVTSNWFLKTSKDLEDRSEKEIASRLAHWQMELIAGSLAMAKKKGLKVVLVWDGDAVANLRTLRIREAAAPARALSELTPQLNVSAEAMTAALKAAKLPLLMPMRLPADNDVELFLGESPYYSKKGMTRYTQSLAKSLIKRGFL